VRAGSTDDALDSMDGGWKVEGTGGSFESVVRTSDLRVKDVCGRRGCEFPTPNNQVHECNIQRNNSLTDQGNRFADSVKIKCVP
jgi:hypothetical protein